MKNLPKTVQPEIRTDRRRVVQKEEGGVREMAKVARLAKVPKVGEGAKRQKGAAIKALFIHFISIFW